MEKFKKIDELLEVLNNLRPLTKDELNYINTKTRIEHVWSSTALEGNTINEEETAWIIMDGLTVANHPLREHFEIKATDLAYSKMLDLVNKKTEITEDVIRELNKTVTTFTETDLERWGEYRKVLVYPFGGDKNAYTPWQEIPTEMEKLIEWLKQDKSHPVERAALLHLKFVTTHPFVDGNGRSARLLMNLILVQHGYPVINIQPDEASRLAYIKALKKAQIEGDDSEFIDLIVNYVETTLQQRIEWIT
jgi:Fic family protein